MPRMGLTPEKVVDGAAEIADRDGLDALSLSLLATSLGVRVPSLYKHIDGLEDVRRRLAARGVQALVLALDTATAGRTGREALLAVAVAYRSFARTHRGLYEALAHLAPAAADPSMPALRRVAEQYDHFGADGAHVAQSVRAALHGHVTLENAGRLGDRAAADAGFAALLALLDRGLSAEQHRRGFRLPGGLSLPGLPGLGR